MPYAIYEEGERLTRVFVTKDDAWKAADRAGLVEMENGKRVLEAGLEIRPCDAEPEGSDDAGSDFLLS